MAERWWAWLTEHAGTTVQVEIAKLTGVEQSAASRWRLGKNLPRPEVAIAVARRLNRPAVEALVAAGFLAPDEASAQVQAPAREPTNNELIQMIRDRMEGQRDAQEVPQPQPSKGSAQSSTGAPNTQGSSLKRRPALETGSQGVRPSTRYRAELDQRDAAVAEGANLPRKTT
jgi:transcriptional regulator with XRE-family HTH domain